MKILSIGQMYNNDISSLPVASALDVEGVLCCILRIEIETLALQPSGEMMTGCLDKLIEKGNEMGLDKCWDELSDDDKEILELVFR